MIAVFDLRDPVFLSEGRCAGQVTGSDGVDDDLWVAYGRGDDCHWGDHGGTEYTELKGALLLGCYGRARLQPVTTYSTQKGGHCEFDRYLLGEIT